MMAESTCKDKLAVYSCPICLEKINGPKCLPCLHTFCEKCLQTFISRASVGKDPEKFDFECPVCRRVTGRPEPGITVDEWAKFFPTDILVNSLMDSNDKEKDQSCAICLRDNKKSKAESWCHDCAEAICSSCKHLHQIIASLRKHKILALNLDEKDDQFNFPELDEPCHLHQGKYVEVFCLDHETLCCSVCFATQHRHCEHVEALDEVSKNMPKSVVEWNIDALSKLSKIIEETAVHKENEILRNNAKKEEILKNVSTEIANIKTKFDDLQQQFEKSFLKKHDDIEEKLKQCIFDMKQYLLTVKNGGTLLSAVQKGDSSKQTFLCALKILRDVDQQFEHYKARNAEDEEYDYEHDHTTILKQICEHDKIDDVTLLTRPSGNIWSLSKYFSAFPIFENMDKEKTSAMFENLQNPFSLKAVKKLEFQLPTPAQQGIFINSETLAMISSSNSLLFYNLADGTSRLCNPPLEIAGNPFLSSGQTRDTFYISCLSKIRKLKIKNIKGTTSATCIREIDLKQDFCVFDVDEEHNRIVIASTTQVTIFSLSPILSITNTITFQNPQTAPVLALSNTCDRLAIVGGNNEVVCFSITGEEIFRHQQKDKDILHCLLFDPKNNMYSLYWKYPRCENFAASCGSCRRVGSNRKVICRNYSLSDKGAVCNNSRQFTYNNCENCGETPNVHLKNGEVLQIAHDGSSGRCFISNCPLGDFMFFNQAYDDLFNADGMKCIVYTLDS
ncbi:uncharacterized protein LOC133174624 [Saccostrea echinata]|uniref:uncharacterized protein LOC133174624 n=1 Tax=Saccostrea echinata TaxID=191078 RepID=UPI002A7F8B1F|nr:uncharacterized protein LOC133174624 [Saccostrea echinata]